MAGPAVWDEGEAAMAGGQEEGTGVGGARAEGSAALGGGGGVDSVGGSGVTGVGNTASNLFGNDLASKTDQAKTQQGNLSSAATPQCGDGSNKQVVGRDGVNGTSFPLGGSTSLTKRRNSMAFEIARMERAGRTLPQANLEKATRVWELSRPRYVEKNSEHDLVGSEGGGEWTGRGGGKRGMRVPPGQENKDAVPYGVWKTSWAQMGDFGLDVGMYFVTLSQLVGAVLVYAALCVVAMVHFSSDQYSGQQEGVRTDLRGSAVCTSLLSVLAYEDETLSSFTQSAVDRNDCPLDAKQGYADMAGVLLLFLLLLLLGKAQEKATQYTDTQIQSAQAYTVKVSSPDPLADDPDRWRRLFAQFGHVSYVTVARGNGSLLRAMAKRRVVGRHLEGSTAEVSQIVEAYRAVDTKERPPLGPGGWWKALLQPFGIFRDTNYWRQQLWAAHDQVEVEVAQGMHDQGLPVVKVFITFESDVSQAQCLSQMSRGIFDSPEAQHMYTNPDGFKKALHVMPASPASEVLYENLHIGAVQRAAAQMLTFALTAGLLVVAYLVAARLHSAGVAVTALWITVVDIFLPSLVRGICSLERHHNVVAHDLSIMNKLTLARWANIAAIPFMLNDRIGTLTAGNLELVVTVLWLNAFVPPVFRLLDLQGRWSRNILAKKEVVQSAMDAHFEGSWYHLSDRYTDTTKTIFACLAYAPVLPIAMWLCLLALALSYWADKWLFMRSWRTPQPPGNSGRVARLARRHMALAVLAHCVLALYYYAGWPFDHVCRFQGGWIECSQEGTGLVEAETQAWMTGPQKTLVGVFSVLNVTWLIILLVYYYLHSIMTGISLVVKGVPREVRSRQIMPFSQLTSRYQHQVDAYVPRVNPSQQLLPLLACDLNLLDPETIPWQADGQKGESFENYCLSSFRDLPRISRYQRARLFSMCVHYPAPAPFETMGNNRASKTDIDWFRRPPPPGRQETKIPEASEEVGDITEQVGQQQQQQRNGHAPVDAIPGLMDEDYASQHPRSQAALESSVHPQSSIHRGSLISAEGESVPMLPGGAQSSLVSTAIVRADGLRTGGEEDDGSGGVGGGGGSSGGKTIEASAEGIAVGEMDSDGDIAMASSGMSDRSGTGRYLASRIGHGDEHSDICTGEGADEFIKRRTIGREGGFSLESATEDGASAGEGSAPLASAAAAAAASDGRMSSLARSRHEDDLSFYEEGSRVQEVEDNFVDLPTPVRAGAGGEGAAGESGSAGRVLVRPDGTPMIHSHRSNSSEGWVDQYTNSSVGVGTKEKPPAGTAHPPALKVGGGGTATA